MNIKTKKLLKNLARYKKTCSCWRAVKKWDNKIPSKNSKSFKLYLQDISKAQNKINKFMNKGSML